MFEQQIDPTKQPEESGKSGESQYPLSDDGEVSGESVRQVKEMQERLKLVDHPHTLQKAAVIFNSLPAWFRQQVAKCPKGAIQFLEDLQYAFIDNDFEDVKLFLSDLIDLEKRCKKALANDIELSLYDEILQNNFAVYLEIFKGKITTKAYFPHLNDVLYQLNTEFVDGLIKGRFTQPLYWKQLSKKDKVMFRHFLINWFVKIQKQGVDVNQIVLMLRTITTLEFTLQDKTFDEGDTGILLQKLHQRLKSYDFPFEPFFPNVKEILENN